MNTTAMGVRPQIELKQTDTSVIPGYKKWLIVYPNHINSELTKDKGRKISKEHGVKNPNIREIAEACAQLQLPCIIEPQKGYPKEFFVKGRVRVNFKNETTQQPRNGSIINKTILYCKIAEIIKLNQPTRPEAFNPVAAIQMAPVQAVSAKKQAAAAQQTPTTTTTTTTTPTSPPPKQTTSSSKNTGKKKKNVNVI